MLKKKEKSLDIWTCEIYNLDQIKKSLLYIIKS